MVHRLYAASGLSIDALADTTPLTGRIRLADLTLVEESCESIDSLCRALAPLCGSIRPRRLRADMPSRPAVERWCGERMAPRRDALDTGKSPKACVGIRQDSRRCCQRRRRCHRDPAFESRTFHRLPKTQQNRQNANPNPTTKQSLPHHNPPPRRACPPMADHSRVVGSEMRLWRKSIPGRGMGGHPLGGIPSAGEKRIFSLNNQSRA